MAMMNYEMEKLRRESRYLKQLLVKMMNQEKSNIPGDIISKQSTFN